MVRCTQGESKARKQVLVSANICTSLVLNSMPSWLALHLSQECARGPEHAPKKSFASLSWQENNIQTTGSFSFYLCFFASLSEKHLGITEQSVKPDNIPSPFVIPDLQ